MKMLSGKSCDDAYVKDMLEDHEEDVADFENDAEAAKDPDVRALPKRRFPPAEPSLWDQENSSGTLEASAQSSSSTGG
jgi:hypothetical protein